MRLIQFSEQGHRHVGVVDGESVNVVDHVATVYELALQADRAGMNLAAMIDEKSFARSVAYEDLIRERRLLVPLDHPDPAHQTVTGTGLTHLGSAQARDSFHSDVEAGSEEPETDSMKLFRMGIDGGKPPSDQISVQPEWFYKGSGHSVVAPGQELPVPDFALDSGEEAEITGLYVIGQSGRVLRVGFALGNEFSDHVMERQNYLYLAHSKLRACSYGPELLVGELPDHVQGQVRILRDGVELWQDSFLTGEQNMSYNIRDLEHHHFKYPGFRIPGDVHCHFFGTASLSISAGIRIQHRDVVEIAAPAFGRPLRNSIGRSDSSEATVHCHPL